MSLQPNIAEECTIRPLPPFISEISSWQIAVEAGGEDVSAEMQSLMACAMTDGGESIIGVGDQGVIWIWKRRV